MTVYFSAGQRAWLQAHVERGEFRSMDEAARQLLEERIAERMIEDDDDLAWAKPYVDEAIAAAERGEVFSRAEQRARNAARLSALKD